MTSFWEVKDGEPVRFLGRPKEYKGTSFARNATDQNYLDAGLYTLVEWDDSGFDQRTHVLPPPTFTADVPSQEVRVNYVPVAKSQADIDQWDADEAEAQQRIADEVALQAEKDTEFASTIPSWAQVDNTITNISDLDGAKTFLRKLARVVYLTTKEKVE